MRTGRRDLAMPIPGCDNGGDFIPLPPASRERGERRSGNRFDALRGRPLMNPGAVVPPSCEGPDSVLADLIDRLTERIQAGENVDLQAWLCEHPEHAEQLRVLLPTVQALA